LANDLGKALGCGAYLKSLRREKIGDFNVDNSSLPNEISNLDLLLEKSFTLID
jgi:tRNA U55 pseudouridine synthase TruB